jgi:hypothetical protein
VVLSRVLELVALQVKTMGEGRLRLEDHTGRMLMVLAADAYYDYHRHLSDVGVPDAALEAAELHRRFAMQAFSTSGAEGDEAMEKLEAMARECFLARGRICPSCELPHHMHLLPNGCP